MCTVQLDTGKARILGNFCGMGEAFDHVKNFIMLQRARFAKSCPGHNKLFVGRADGRRRDVCWGLTTRMADLHPQMRVVFRASLCIGP